MKRMALYTTLIDFKIYLLELRISDATDATKNRWRCNNYFLINFQIFLLLIPGIRNTLFVSNCAIKIHLIHIMSNSRKCFSIMKQDIKNLFKAFMFIQWTNIHVIIIDRQTCKSLQYTIIMSNFHRFISYLVKFFWIFNI